jgi:chemotaxis protein CheX
MSQPTQPVNVRKYLERQLIDVFQTMLSKQAVPVETHNAPNHCEHVTGSVGFAGETVNGAVYLHMTSSFAANVAAAMLGLPPEELTAETEINDVIGEVTNMLAGGLKSEFCDAGSTCAVSIPAIIRGTSFVVEAMPDVECIRLKFDCQGENVMVEVHVKHKQPIHSYAHQNSKR